MSYGWRKSTFVLIYKNKGDFRIVQITGIKLMSHTMKLWEKVIERRLRCKTSISKNQFGFMAGRSTTEAIYLIRGLMERYRSKRKDLHMIFIDVENAYDNVPRDLLWKVLEKKEVHVGYIRVIQNMYEGVMTSVRTPAGETNDFPIRIGLHQGSALSPYLFNIVLDVLTSSIQEEIPKCMLFADDIVILGDSKVEINWKLELWRTTLESQSFRISRSKTEYMCCSFDNRQTHEDIETVLGEDVIRQVDKFKYLGSVIQEDCEVDGDINNRIQAGWCKWRKASGIICDRMVQTKVKGEFYRTAIRPVLSYGSECWAIKKQQEHKMDVSEMKMLRWSSGYTLKDRIRNDHIRERVGVAPISEKMREYRLRWYEHVQRRELDEPVRIVEQTEREPYIRNRGRPKRTLDEVIQRDMVVKNLSVGMTRDRAKWRRVIHVADPI